MFIRVKNLSADTELNINTRNIVAFEPANGGANTKLLMSNGNSYVIAESNRTLRHAVKKANEPFEGSASTAESHKREGELKE